jgi:mono/diheme cytochrome c family protein
MKRWIKRIAIALGALVGVALLAVIALNVVSVVRERRTYAVAVTPLAIASDAATIARGRHLATAVGGCVDCHDADFGGRVLIDRLLIGRLVASNLTRGQGGLPTDYTDPDLIRAIRHGVGRSGRSLIFMPSEGFHSFSDHDLAALIAYLRSVPAVDRALPETRVGPLARVLHVFGFPLLPAERIDHEVATLAPTPGASIEYGRYLASVAGCHGCHGPALAGGEGPGPNITTGAIGSWTEQDFRRAVREGTRPDGTGLKEPMPWKVFARMTDDEVAALWMYVRSTPGVAKPPK